MIRHRVPFTRLFSWRGIAFCAILGLATGCQQTTGITPGSPLTPVSPLAPTGLQPVQPTSAIGPLGNRTRVPPPATGAYSPRGSYSVPNNYMGGSTPLSFNSAPAPVVDGWQQSGVAPASATMPNGGGAIGSGVAPAGGTTYGSGFHDLNNRANTIGAGQFPSAPLSPARPNLRPQSAGMPINDLTRAPAPPGYRSYQYAPGLTFDPRKGYTNPAPARPAVPFPPNGSAPFPSTGSAVQSSPSLLPAPSPSGSGFGSDVRLPNPQSQAAFGAGNSAAAPFPSTAPAAGPNIQAAQSNSPWVRSQSRF